MCVEPTICEVQAKGILQHLSVCQDSGSPHLCLLPNGPMVSLPHTLKREHEAMGGPQELQKLLSHFWELILQLLDLILLKEQGANQW